MEIDLTSEQERIYVHALSTLKEASVDFLISGALATHYYTAGWRNTKDLDLFLRPEDRDRALAVLSSTEFNVEVTTPFWLAKAFSGEVMVDIITGFGNLVHQIDQSWFDAAVPCQILGIDTSVVSAADLIWAKAYVAGRERFDGADIAHMIRRSENRIDWERLLGRFGDHWDLLLLYLHYYRFVYPSARDRVPVWVMEELATRLQVDLKTPAEPDHPFRGPLLDRYSYLVDIQHWGEIDPRETVAAERQIPLDQVVADRIADQRRRAEQ